MDLDLRPVFLKVETELAFDALPGRKRGISREIWTGSGTVAGAADLDLRLVSLKVETELAFDAMLVRKRGISREIGAGSGAVVGVAIPLLLD